MHFVFRALFSSVVIALLLSLSPNAAAQEVDLRFERYEELLNGLLKTRRDEEKEFVAGVIAQVRAGTIPERLVETSYKWVLNKRPDTNYPFVYFERVLRIQATELGIGNTIPAFDFEVYRSRIARGR